MHQQMQHQKMQLHSGRSSLHHSLHSAFSSRNSSLGLSGANKNSSLHRFSVDALAGTASSDTSSKEEQMLNVTSDDDDNSIASWDEDIGIDDEEEDEEIDVGPLSPTAVSTTSDSSRGGTSPAIKRRKHWNTLLCTRVSVSVCVRGLFEYRLNYKRRKNPHPDHLRKKIQADT